MAIGPSTSRQSVLTKPVNWAPAAGATKPCPTCEAYEGDKEDSWYGGCRDCDGTHRVYFFGAETGVRPECPGDPRAAVPFCYLGYPNLPDTWETCICHGLGWVANRDGFTWLTVASHAFPSFIDRWSKRWNDYRNMTYKCNLPADLQTDFLEFINKLIVASGGTLMEVPDAPA